MIQMSPKPVRLEEFLKLPDTKPAREYISGEIVRKPMPGARHSRLQGRLTSAINAVAEEGQIACAFPELRCTFAGRSLVPDVAVLRPSRIEFRREWRTDR